MFEGGKPPFKGDRGAIRLPGQGAGAFLRVPHRQAGLRSARGPLGLMEKLATKRAKFIKAGILLLLGVQNS